MYVFVCAFGCVCIFVMVNKFLHCVSQWRACPSLITHGAVDLHPVDICVYLQALTSILFYIILAIVIFFRLD